MLIDYIPFSESPTPLPLLLVGTCFEMRRTDINSVSFSSPPSCLDDIMPLLAISYGSSGLSSLLWTEVPIYFTPFSEKQKGTDIEPNSERQLPPQQRMMERLDEYQSFNLS